MTIDYEICSDPFDPRCVSANSMYPPGAEPEESKRFMERIRGKEEDMIHNYTRDEEYHLIDEQIQKSQGFDVDFSMFRVHFNFYPSILDECHCTRIQEIDREFFGKLANEAIVGYNDREGTNFEFVEVVKANIYSTSGYTYFITFVVKEGDDQTKIFQAKVCNVFCREIVHNFCRQKPDQEVKSLKEFKGVVKKRRVQEEGH